MTKFYKQVVNGHIIGIGTNGNDSVTPITEKEYADILAVIANRPADPYGYTNVLKNDTLEWELIVTPLEE